LCELVGSELTLTDSRSALRRGRRRVGTCYGRLVGSAESAIVAAVLSETLYGLSGSGLSEIDSAADSVPDTLGLNVTVIVQALPAASFFAQVPPLIEKSLALLPLTFS
jgi:hypothetical protein